jgi:hypothetical protein
MFDHELNPRKGWPSPYAVDYAAEYADGETDYAYAGRVVSLDANGKFEMGLSADSAMAIFLFQNYTDFDVRSDVGNISGEKGSGLVAIGAYELQSTEFVADTYVPNDLLTVDDGSGTAADVGKLKKGTLGADPIVGVVSSGQSDSEHDATIKLLAFWPVYQPV